MTNFLTKTVSKTSKKLGKTLSKAAEKGENLVIGKPPGRTASGRDGRGVSRHSSGKGKKSPARSTSGKGSRRRERVEEGSDEVHMFCSDMYTHDFVVDAAKQVEEDSNVTSLILEDLIQRNCNDTSEVIINLMADNFFSNGGNKKANKAQRIWTSISFIDCISDVDSYKNYLDLKAKFTANMKRSLAAKGMSKDLPVKFEAKIELHTMLDIYGVIQLLQAVERDDSVKSVNFPGFRGEDKDVVEAFSKFADTETMEWKETVGILVKYRRNGPKNYKGAKNPNTIVVGDLAKALQCAMFSGSSADLNFEEESGDFAAPSFLAKPGMKDESVTEVSLFDSPEGDLRVRKMRSGSPQEVSWMRSSATRA
ncbi:expressed unknown protein [Seminavis robusta]|uniref:Uncharacterized protein n=1 Tax=Seminavis robusta TaxID=568900 RepID=A0A9N8H2P0_9STRA|nr:expressed unknown protein [Seminavis robusta]|eukprot:Sro12_g009340.1 n/a (366) ;mRNA; f:92911-94218